MKRTGFRAPRRPESEGTSGLGTSDRRSAATKTCILVVIALVAALTLNVGIPATLAANIACDPAGCISVDQFSANISKALRNKVVGYVFIIGGTRTVFGGQARTSADPPRTAMLPDVPTNIASVTKVLTTIAVVQSLAKHGLTLDSKISPYLYRDWHRGPLINTITFRELLTHAAGFRANCDGSNTTYAVLKQQIANGVRKTDMVDTNGNPVHSYNNCNFAIFRELLPQMERRSIKLQPESVRAAQSAAFYISYMNAHVFKPVGVPTRACRPPKAPNASYRYPAMLSYPFPARSAHGNDWGDWTLACGGGGWVLSAGDLYKVINDLANGHALLTDAEKLEMNASAPNCIGWDCTVRNDCPDPYLCKNGSLDAGNISVWTYAGILKCNVPVVVVVNSVLPAPYEGNEDIIGLVKDAYDGAKAPGAPRACR